MSNHTFTEDRFGPHSPHRQKSALPHTSICHSASAPEVPSEYTFGAQVKTQSLRFPPGLWDSSYPSTVLSGPAQVDNCSPLHFLGTLGRGGYGKVLLADSSSWNGQLPQFVAVKVLAKKHMTIAGTQEIKDEIEVLRKLGEFGSRVGAAFVQKMYVVYQTKGHVFIVMDRHCAPLSHPALKTQLRLRPCDSPPLAATPLFPISVSLPIAFPSCSTISTPYEEALNSLRLLAAELVLGLVYLHEQGIVHQDIKPANVLVSSEGHVVITDLGSARHKPHVPSCDESSDFASNAAWVSSHTPTKFGPIVLHADDQFSYTRRYAAPELTQASLGPEGRHIITYDERVDYYSLGTMLRELALQETSADSQDRWECASDGAQRQDPPAIDGDLVNLIDALTTTDPGYRLHGTAVKEHPFFHQLAGLWCDIAVLKYPPFTQVIWPAADFDTTLDLRAYGGDDDSQTSLVSHVESWSAELANIPYEFDIESYRLPGPGQRYPPHPTQTPPCYIAPSPQVPTAITDGIQSKLDDIICETPSASQPNLWGENSSRFGTPNDHSVLPSVTTALPSVGRLSLIPTIPSLASSSIFVPRGEPTILPQSTRISHPLRRRQVVYDLRRAFRHANAGAEERYGVSPPPSPPVVLERVQNHWNLKRSGMYQEYRPALVPQLSFEDEITVALLASMNGKALTAVTTASGLEDDDVSPQSVPTVGNSRLNKPTLSILRRVKDLVSWFR